MFYMDLHRFNLAFAMFYSRRKLFFACTAR